MTVVSKNGKQVRLYDDKGNATKTYKKNGSKSTVYEQATINGQLMYRIGSSKQWIPAKYSKVTLKKTTTAKKTTANVTVYNSKGKTINCYTRNSKRQIVKTYIKKGSKVDVWGQGPINGRLMYNISRLNEHGEYARDAWVPAKDVQVDYFKGVQFIDYCGSGTPAQTKAKYDANLAEIENNDSSSGEATCEWFEAHPLENLRVWSQDFEVSKSTYEKHNQTYAQRAAEFGRTGVLFTKESYTAYIKGKTSYRQYEAKWAAKYPKITRNVTKSFATDSKLKKYNLNTFEWHFDDKFYIHYEK
ncbi:hypothetical protein lacNasYZ03_14720 [Lactobacillus nasalidis]|uniref:Surface layer protein A domain-containing protein n=1 Tax=Lactobacillus nasalidis TaxID=2797258 RepID=A0ABQ3W8W3_9LACO|nr:hypothetical protein lacNasYZ01_16020 [Lactobacillus nasalidis]GHV98886.1 hypothetical protein lacNasYZ02_03160 [Lactobacillus nasalidis]GHW01785.1 hypothetical protein lacNasYZ03_14720 [Lactobacillus nasalidis]